jgi:hypothetical protein
VRARGLVLVGFALLAALPPAARAASGEEAAARRLAERYAPIAMLREQTEPPCNTSEEQYQPTSVDTVLGNPDVTLTRYVPGRGLEDVKKAPSAADVAGLGDDYYLDLPGRALGDTCVYARDFERLKREGRAPAVVYAHIAREPGHSGFALQYWFFWYFNQFNDLHEGDWEGMQVTFEADTPAAALAEEPSQIILFQHAGGERADWGDGKVRKEGRHPVVYPAAGSHATFYDSAIYVENGQHGSGLGCDNTTAPLRELRLRPVLMPEAVPRSGRFEWLSYDGRWGEREKGFNNGPQGPQTKTVWREPFAWMDAQRTTSPRLPGGTAPVLGAPVAGAFCGAVATASELVNLDAKSRPAAIATILGVLLLIGLFVGLTRWRPVDLEHLQARRSFGQLARTARQLYGRHWRVLVPVAIVAVPIVGGVNLLTGLLGEGHAIGDGGRSGFNLALADLVDSFARPAAMAVVAAIVVILVRLLVEGEERPGFRTCFRGMRPRFWRLVGGQMLFVAAMIALAATVVGLPFAAYKYVAWSFVKQEILFEERGIRDAFHGSADLVRGRWWHSVRFVLFLFAVSVVTGPLLTFALIFTTLPLVWVNLLGSLVFALLIPYVALGETLLYLDLRARAQTEGIRPARSWRPWRPRQFGRVRRPAGHAAGA